VHKRALYFSNSTCHVSLLITFFLYSQREKVRPPATFVSASGKTSILSQVLSELESTASSACKYFIYFYTPQLIILIYIFQNKRYKASISIFHWQWFDASDPHHQVSLLLTVFFSISFYIGSTTANILNYVHR
jgi:hypothetical protein